MSSIKNQIKEKKKKKEKKPKKKKAKSINSKFKQRFRINKKRI